jgi:hypothetical protein
VAPIWLGSGSWSRPIADEGDIDTVQDGGEPVNHAGEPADDLGKAVQGKLRRFTDKHKIIVEFYLYLYLYLYLVGYPWSGGLPEEVTG